MGCFLPHKRQRFVDFASYYGSLEPGVWRCSIPIDPISGMATEDCKYGLLCGSSYTNLIVRFKDFICKTVAVSTGSLALQDICTNGRYVYVCGTHIKSTSSGVIIVFDRNLEVLKRAYLVGNSDVDLFRCFFKDGYLFATGKDWGQGGLVCKLDKSLNVVSAWQHGYSYNYGGRCSNSVLLWPDNSASIYNLSGLRSYTSGTRLRGTNGIVGIERGFMPRTDVRFDYSCGFAHGALLPTPCFSPLHYHMCDDTVVAHLLPNADYVCDKALLTNLRLIGCTDVQFAGIDPDNNLVYVVSPNGIDGLPDLIATTPTTLTITKTNLSWSSATFYDATASTTEASLTVSPANCVEILE